MDPQKLKKLSDLFGQELAGWQITPCYFLELDHGLMAMFPAIDKNKEPVITLNKLSLRKVWNRLERRPAKVTSLMVIAHPTSGVAFNIVNNLEKGDLGPLRIFSDEEIESLCKEDLVLWAPGLLQLSERPVFEPVFT